MQQKKSVIVIGASSDIGRALSKRWLARKWLVSGTYRTKSSEVNELEKSGARLVRCDVSSSPSIRRASKMLRKLCSAWDVLVMCPASLEPIVMFEDCTFDKWAYSIELNFIDQLRIVHKLLPARRIKYSPCVLFFSGGGINAAPTNYSAYTISKIATIKMCELLDAEIPDTRFVTLGPGWVKTKIHRQTLAAAHKAGSNYKRTLEKLKSGDFTPMEDVLDYCDWIVSAPRKIVSGRNFSVVYDNVKNKKLTKRLAKNPNLFKLRKYGSIIQL